MSKVNLYKIKATASVGYEVYKIQDTENGLIKDLFIGEFSNFGYAKEYVELKNGSYDLYNQWGDKK